MKAPLIISLVLSAALLNGCNEDTPEVVDLQKLQDCASPRTDAAKKAESCAALNATENTILECAKHGSKHDFSACQGLTPEQYALSERLDLIRRKQGTNFNFSTRKLGE